MKKINNATSARGTTIGAVLLTAWLTGLPLNALSADSTWMQGFPPPVEQRVNRQDFSIAPKNRWSLQHIRELQPTRGIWRGTQPIVRLPVTLKDLGSFSSPVRNG